jgi:hypothetical protein
MNEAVERMDVHVCRPDVVDSTPRPRALPMMKLLYKPFAIIAGVVASRAAGAIFKRLWAFLAKETEMPQAMEQYRSWTEVVAAGLLKGAVFGGVKAFVDRAFATEYFRRTGVWPGKIGGPKI